MDIGFEAKRFFNNRTGLGNYSRFIIDALSSSFPNNNYLLYAPNAKAPKDADTILARSNVKVVTPNSLYTLSRSTSLWRTWGMSHGSSVKELKIFHGLSQELPIGLPLHVKKVVTIHDLIYLRYPQFYSRVDAMIYRLKAKSACDAADRVIAVSQQTALDVSNYLNIPSEKISVVYQGCHENFERTFSVEQIQEVKKKHALPAEYILNVGTIEERKNLMLIVKALALLPDSERIAVVVIGKRTDYFDKVVLKAQKLNVLKHFIFLQNVSFDELPAIYQGAKVFVYPSLFEGFGIPLIEAITSNVPVITSKGSCLHEAAGPDSLYVDSDDEQMLAAHISRVIHDDAFANRMRLQSKAYINKFRKPVIAENLFSIYKQLT